MAKLENRIRSKVKNHFVTNGVEVLVKDSPPKNVDIKKVVNHIFKRIPGHLLTNLDIIYVGQFQNLISKNFQAMYKDSSIFVSNEIKSNEDLLDDLIHEIAHSVEDQYDSFIYSDNKIEKEFIYKRKKLWMILKDEGMDVSLEDFLETKYNQNFDEQLYLEIGYPTLRMFSRNIFYSPYACTSLREYFANGFEAFFMKEDIPLLKRVSPVLYNRIIDLMKIEE